MIKTVCLYFVIFAFIITSCYEQATNDSTVSDSQSNQLYDDTNSSDNGTELHSDSNVKTRNKSGSRLIFNEYHLSDGSIIYDSVPIDSVYNRICTLINGISTISPGLEGCCVSFATPSALVYKFYKDSNCTNEVSLLKFSNKINNGDIVKLYTYPDNIELYNACGREPKFIYAQVVTPINHSIYTSVPTNDGNKCVTWAEYTTHWDSSEKCYNLAGYKEISIEEARSFFVCTE